MASIPKFFLLIFLLQVAKPRNDSVRGRKDRIRKTYSRGELNKMIDSALHPLIRLSPVFLLIDQVAHMMVEQNPQESVVKFVRYTLPQIIKKLLKEVE